MIDFEMMETIATIIGFTGGILSWSCKQAYGIAMASKIIWGFFDYPTSTSTHYYIIVKRAEFNKKEFEKKIKIILKCQGTPLDYNVRVTTFLTDLSSEHLRNVAIKIQDQETHKVIECQLSCNVLYRIIVETAGSFKHGLDIESTDITIKSKTHKIPYKKYII